MATLTLSGVPEPLIERLTARAAENGRSVSDEAIAALEQWVETAELLLRIRSFREQLSVPPLTDAELRRMKNAGRA